MRRKLIENRLKINANYANKIKDSNTKKKEIDDMLKGKIKPFYTEMYGLSCYKNNLLSDHAKNMAQIFFKIMEDNNVEYIVFAGSSIGLLRDKKQIPYADDYDIIVMDDRINDFTRTFNILIDNGFSVTPGKAGYKVFCTLDCPRGTQSYSYFQVDIFFSKFNKDGKLISINDWGRYHGKGITRSEVFPLKKCYFDDMMNLPFMNDVEAEVDKCYGNIDKAIIHIQHGRSLIHGGYWEDVYDNFNKIFKQGIVSTQRELGKIQCRNKGIIENMKLSIEKKSILLGKASNNVNYFLKMLALTGIEHLYILETRLLMFVPDIKKFIPGCKIYVYLDNNKQNIKKYLDYIDILVSSKKNILDFYDQSHMIYNKKCKLVVMKRIDFTKMNL